MKSFKKRIHTLLELYKSKNLSKAEIYNKNLLREFPKVVYLYNILGLILSDLGKGDEAIDCFIAGTKVQPNNLDNALIYNNLGSIYFSRNNNIEAEHNYKKSININNKISDPHNNLGNLFLKLNKYKEAISSYQEAIDINPKFYVAHYNIGVAYKNIGKFADASKHFNEAINLNSDFFTAHRSLSQITNYKKNDSHLNLLNEKYRDKKIEKGKKTELAFALAKASEDINDIKNAFQYYKQGNDLRRLKINFSIDNEKEEFNIIKKVFNIDFLKKFDKSINSNRTAIFILGMPRSGTTLIEQILSNHPKVYGGDEIYLLPDLIKKNFYDLNDISNVNFETLSNISTKYISYLKDISQDSERVTDKLPINFKWIGLIKILLPKSKIIHCVRNSKDLCFSIFKNYFTNNRFNFAYNLDEIVFFYNLYHDLMIYWKKIIPNFIIDIKYENLIEEPENEIRKLIKSCDLNWNENCLKFYDNKRPIKTASDIQARKKIYKSSMNSWKKYEVYVKENFEKLSN